MTRSVARARFGLVLLAVLLAPSVGYAQSAISGLVRDTTGGVLPGVAPLFAPAADPRYNAFDWETWHEIDVLRRELAPRFAGAE